MRTRIIVMLAIGALGSATTAKPPAPASLRLPVIYEAQDVPRQASETRIDFFRVNQIGGGFDYRLSGVDDSSAERRRSEFGGIARFLERPTFHTIEPFVLYLPRSGVNAWSDRDIRCVSEAVAPAATKIDCIWSKSGAHYQALFSHKRGIEWFDKDCGSGVCRYVLKTPTGLWSHKMMNTLKRYRLIRKI